MKISIKSQSIYDFVIIYTVNDEDHNAIVRQTVKKEGEVLIHVPTHLVEFSLTSSINFWRNSLACRKFLDSTFQASRHRVFKATSFFLSLQFAAKTVNASGKEDLQNR
jgi:hypothetical protein